MYAYIKKWIKDMYVLIDDSFVIHNGFTVSALCGICR